MQRVGDHNLNRFGVNAHSSHRFGLSAQTAPALTRRLPFSPGCVLRLCLLDFKAVIFAYHKLHSRLLAHHRRFNTPEDGRVVSRSSVRSAPGDTSGRSGCGRSDTRRLSPGSDRTGRRGLPASASGRRRYPAEPVFEPNSASFHIAGDTPHRGGGRFRPPPTRGPRLQRSFINSLSGSIMAARASAVRCV